MTSGSDIGSTKIRVREKSQKIRDQRYTLPYECSRPHLPHQVKKVKKKSDLPADLQTQQIHSSPTSQTKIKTRAPDSDSSQSCSPFRSIISAGSPCGNDHWSWSKYRFPCLLCISHFPRTLHVSVPDRT